ncbi:MAG TPA: hypothetical protein VH561_09335 [Micromonosporaceae bacterium]|jgi:hypothetical protein
MSENRAGVLRATCAAKAMSVALAALALGALVACSSGGTNAPTGGPAPGDTTAPGAGGGATDACSKGLTVGDPGVVSIRCDGTATVTITVGSAASTIAGGTCYDTADGWTAAFGVVVDREGVGGNGAYTGPNVDNVAINTTDQPGKATIQAVIDGKVVYDLGNATVSFAADKKTAHLQGTSESTSDSPGAALVVDITC